MTQGHRPDLGPTPVNRLGHDGHDDHDDHEHGAAGHSHWVTDRAEQSRLGRRAQLLAAASVAYNVVEAGVAVTAGIAAGSVALLGFGLDSTIEVSSALIILWQFRHRVPESRERAALRALSLIHI